jgi:class 3 adenylate cyclase
VAETLYARSGDVSIAYQVVGEGPFDVVLVSPFVSHVELAWTMSPLRAYLSRLASISRLIVFDKRGTGMSDRVGEVPSLETRMDDVRAVMDAVGSTRAALVGASEASPMSILFAATYPERTSALVLIASFARTLWAPDYPWGSTEEQFLRGLEDDQGVFGPREDAERELAEFLGGDREEARLFVEYIRQSASPGAARAINLWCKDIDVRPMLPAIRVPTLMLHGQNDHIPVAAARWMAERIPGARLIEFPGSGHVLLGAALETACDETEQFLTEVWAGADEDLEPDRVVATVLFTDIVGSSEQAVQLGDRAWGEQLKRHHELVRRQLIRFRGREIDTAGDGFLASFDGPARAIRCACAIIDAVSGLGIQVRAGLHTGECELVDGKVAGIAVHTGARVATQAQPGEVLVSSTVKDLVAGSGLGFTDRGDRQLKGIPGQWRLYAVDRS